MERCADGWELTLGESFPDAQVAFVAAVETREREEAVLKIGWPHREAEREADALLQWDGNAAVRVLKHDRGSNAMLLERCIPGTQLFDLDEDAALDVLIDLLPRLSIPAGDPFTTLADEAAWWLETLEQDRQRAVRPFSARLLEVSIEALRELPATAPEETVLLHQDLHPGNVLRARREPWLAIDPKPLVGERAFVAAPIVRSYELAHDESSVLRRLDRLTSELGIDRERARLWSIAQTVAWSMDEEGADPWLVQTAEWLLGKI